MSRKEHSNTNLVAGGSSTETDHIVETDTWTTNEEESQHDGRGDTGSSPLLASKGRGDQRSRHALSDDQPPPLDYDALLTEAAQSSQKSRTPRHKPKLYMNVR